MFFFLAGTVLLNITAGIAQALRPETKVIFASAAIPGWGQFLNKDQDKGEIMLWAESAIWLLYSGFYRYGVFQTNDALLFARRYANANIKIKSEKYFRALERYNSAEEYNIAIRREARALYPNDPQAQLNYFYNNGYFGDSVWTWKSESLRFRYWDQRRKAKQAFTRASFCIGASLLNRVISIIDCYYFSFNKLSRVNFRTSLNKTELGIEYRF
ncbi:MAG: hypothetical protein ABIK10_04710 [candidate division WOR-3 bacterium]